MSAFEATSQRSDSLFIITDGKLYVLGYNTLLLVIAGCITSQLKDLSSEIFENGGEVDWQKSSAHTDCTMKRSELGKENGKWHVPVSETKNRTINDPPQTKDLGTMLIG